MKLVYKAGLNVGLVEFVTVRTKELAPIKLLTIIPFSLNGLN